MTNSSTRISRSEVLDLCETIHASGPLPVFGGEGAGAVPVRAPDPDLPAPQPAPGAARRGLLRLAGHRLPRHRRLHAPDRPGSSGARAYGGGSGSHGPADHRRHPPGVLVLG